MKKYAVTLIELLITIILMTIIIMFTKAALNKYVPNEETILFKQIFSSVSNAVNNVISNSQLYPKRDLSDTKDAVLNNSADYYQGQAKFFTSFSEQFNILSYFTSSTKLPLYKTNLGLTQIGKPDCFIDNKGITYCAPSNFPKMDLESFYIDVFIGEQNINTMFVLNVNKNGEISIPEKLDGYFNCFQNTYSNYIQCSALEEIKKRN